MITRSSRRPPAWAGERRGPVAGPTHKDVLPCSGEDGHPAPAGADAACRKARPGTSAGGDQSSNYWSSTTYQNNPSNAWNVNFNDGNVNANNKTNSNYVRAVRGGS